MNLNKLMAGLAVICIFWLVMSNGSLADRLTRLEYRVQFLAVEAGRTWYQPSVVQTDHLNMETAECADRNYWCGTTFGHEEQPNTLGPYHYAESEKARKAYEACYVKMEAAMRAVERFIRMWPHPDPDSYPSSDRYACGGHICRPGLVDRVTQWEQDRELYRTEVWPQWDEAKRACWKAEQP